jgi:hypothetical protein
MLMGLASKTGFFRYQEGAEKMTQKTNEGEALFPLQASGLGSKLRAATGYPLGMSRVGSVLRPSTRGSNHGQISASTCRTLTS